MAVQLGAAVGKIEIDLEAFKRGIEEAVAALRGMGDKFNKSADGIKGSLDKVNQSASNMGRGLMTLGAPIVAGMGAAAKVAGDFEEKINILAVAAKGGGVSLDNLREIALKAGADVNLVGVSASDVAIAMTNMTKAGVSSNDMLGDLDGYLAGTAQMGGALRAAIDLAAASELDLDQASQMVITTQNTFGISADQIVQKMNNVVQTADASVASVNDLNEAYKNVGPTMASMNYSFEDTNTMLAILSTRGISGAEAGTALKSMFVNLKRPTKDVEAALASLNVSLYDNQGKAKSAETIVKDLSRALDEHAKTAMISGGATKAQADEINKHQKKIASLTESIKMYSEGAKGASMTDEARAKKLKDLNAELEYHKKELGGVKSGLSAATRKVVDMTDKQREQYIVTLAGSYGMKALNTLVAEGSDGWDEMEKSIGEAATMQETAAARTKGFNAAMEQMKSSVETFLIRVGTPLINDVLTPMVRVFSDLIGKIAELNPQWFKWVAIGGMVVTALGAVLLTVGKLAGALSGIAQFAGLLKAGTLFGPLSGAIGAIGAALGPILPILAVVAAAVGLLYFAWKNNFLGIRDLLDKIIGPIKNFVDTAVRAFKNFLGGKLTLDDFIARIKWAFGNLVAAITPAWNQFKANFEAKWKEISAVVERVWAAIKEVVIRALAQFLAPIFGGVDQAREKIETAFASIGTFLGNVWEGVKTAVAGAWEYIKGLIGGAVEAIRGVIGGLVAFLSGDPVAAWDAIKTGALRAWDAIKTGIANALAIIAPQVVAAWENIKTAVTTKVQEIGTRVATAWENIKTAVGTKVQEIGTQVATAWENIKTTVGTKVQALGATVATTWENIKAGATEKWEAVRSAASEKWEGIKTTISTVVGGIKDFVVNTLGEIVSAAANLFGKIIDAITGRGGAEGGAGGGPGLAGLLNVAQLRATVVEAVTEIQNLQTQTAAILALIPPLFAAAWTTIQASTTTIWTAIQAWWTAWRASELVAFATWLTTLQTAFTTWLAAVQLAIVTTWTTIQVWWTAWRAAELLAFRNWLTALQTEFTTVFTAIATFVLMTFEQLRADLVTTTEAMRAQVVALVQTMANQIVVILQWLVGEGRNAGVGLGNAVADGIRASTGAAVAAARALAAAVRANLPHSDADEGPLSDITDAGRALPETLARGMLAGEKRTAAAARTIAEGMQPAVDGTWNRRAGDKGGAGRLVEDISGAVRVFVTNWPRTLATAAAAAGAAAGEAARAYQRMADDTKRIVEGVDAGLGNRIGLPLQDGGKRKSDVVPDLGNRIGLPLLDKGKRKSDVIPDMGPRIGLPLLDEFRNVGRSLKESVDGLRPAVGAADWAPVALALAGRNAAASMPVGGRGFAPQSTSKPAGGTTPQALNVTINNPAAEAAETSIVRQLRNLAYIGVLAPTG